MTAVTKVAVPETARRLSGLAGGYEDAFVVETGDTTGRTAEDWARAIFEGAPASLRRGLLAGWSSLGLELGPTGSDGTVLGWEVRRATRDFVLLGAGSRLGLPAELLFARRRRTLLFATFVRPENPLARALWAGVIPLHERVVPRVLRGAPAGSPHEGAHPRSTEIVECDGLPSAGSRDTSR